MDRGFSATLNRELARRSDAAAGADDTRDLVRTLEWIITVVVATFAQDLFWLWTGDMALSVASAPIFALLVTGSALNALMNLPCALQLAHGWTRLAFWINVVSVGLVVPRIWIMGREFGGVGAAFVWLALNLRYVTIGILLNPAPLDDFGIYAFAAGLAFALLRLDDNRRRLPRCFLFSQKHTLRVVQEAARFRK